MSLYIKNTGIVKTFQIGHSHGKKMWTGMCIKRLFFEMKSKKETPVSKLVSQKEEIKKICQEAVKENEGNMTSGIKNISDLSKRQLSRQLQALGTRAQKALWFAKHFGLELGRLEFLDNKRQKYGWSCSSTFSSVTILPVSIETPLTANSTPQLTPNNTPHFHHRQQHLRN